MDTLMQDFAKAALDVKALYVFVFLVFLSPVLLGIFLPRKIKIYGVLSSLAGLIALGIVLYVQGVFPMKNLTPDELCARGTDRLKEAWLHDKQNIEGEAEKDLLEAKAKCPTCACSYPKLIILYTYTQRMEQAMQVEEEGMKTIGSSIKTDKAYLQSTVYQKLLSGSLIPEMARADTLRQAKKQYGAMLYLGDGYMAYNQEYLKASNALLTGKLDEAQSIYEGLIQKYPEFADDLYVQLGLVYGKKDDVSEAYKMFQKALSINPDSVLAKKLAELYKD